jgi:hypothetical protein
MPKRVPDGSRRPLKTGYISIRTADGWEYEHRAVWRESFGPIPPGASIHHKNGIRSDNRLENLALMASHADHMRKHPEIGNRYRGRSLSPEHRAKLSEAAKRRCANPAHRAELSERGRLGAEKRWH